MLKNKYRFILFLALGILLMAKITISKEMKPKTIEKTVPTSFMQAKTMYQVNIFYDPKVATKEIVDDVYATVNDRNKLIKTHRMINYIHNI